MKVMKIGLRTDEWSTIDAQCSMGNETAFAFLLETIASFYLKNKAV